MIIIGLGPKPQTYKTERQRGGRLGRIDGPLCTPNLCQTGIPWLTFICNKFPFSPIISHLGFTWLVPSHQTLINAPLHEMGPWQWLIGLMKRRPIILFLHILKSFDSFLTNVSNIIPKATADHDSLNSNSPFRKEKWHLLCLLSE